MSRTAEKEVPKDYVAARQGAAYYVVPNPGYLVFSGETRQEYLQRQTTNDLGLLSSTRSLPNFLTSASGRILEFFTLLQDGESIGMLTQPGHGPGLADYFRKRVFFNDMVAVADKSAEWVQIELYGAAAETTITNLGFERLPKPDEVLQSESLRAIGTAGAAAVMVLIPATESSEVIAKLQGPGLGQETHEILRVEAMQPGSPEFSGDYTPFELGLDRYVSTEKGCYTGQEVLARQVTYDKIVRRLVQVRSDVLIKPSANVVAEGKNVGQVTSSATSPRLGHVALAILRKPFDVAGMTVELTDGDNHVTGSVFLP